MGTNEIMDALKGIQMTAKNKSKLANSIMNASGGQNVVVKEPLMKYYYYKNEHDLYTTLCDSRKQMLQIIGANVNFIARAVEDHDNRDIPTFIPDVWYDMSGYTNVSAICVYGIITMEGKLIDLPTAMAIAMIGDYDPTNTEFHSILAMITAVLKSCEITEEEFFEGIDTSF